MAKKKDYPKKKSKIQVEIAHQKKHTPSVYITIFSLLAILLLLVVFLKPLVLDGLVPAGVDVIGAKGQSHQVQEFHKLTGDVAFWNPYIFSGMPIYFRFAAQIPSIDSVVKYLGELLNAVFLWYLVGAIGMFFCLRYFGLSHITALFGALIFVLFPHYKSLWVEGHFMKFRAVMIVPWVTLSAVNFFDKRTLFGAALLALAWGNQIRTQHYQIVFYTAWLIFAIGIYPMLRELFEKKWQKFLKSFLFLSLALGFAVFMAAQPLFLAKEYLPYSARGAYTNDINKQIESNTENKKQGMTFEKAMQWSTHPSELATWVVPRFLGGMSSVKYNGDKYQHIQGQTIPGYWGKMPFTQSNEYFGVLILFLAAIGFYYKRKNSLFLSLSILALFFILLSFGRHFEFLNRALFNFIPVFDKFRAPMMSVTITYLIMVLLAAVGIDALYKNSQKLELKQFYQLAGLFGGIGIVLWFAGSFMGFVKPGESYAQNVMTMIVSIRKELFYQDIVRYFILLGFGCIIMVTFLLGKIHRWLFIGLMLLVVLSDTVLINNRKSVQFVNNRQLERNYFYPSTTDNYLRNDNETYRIFPVGRLFGDNRWCYYHQSIGGYSAVKMNLIEEIIQNNLYNGPDPRLPINWNILKILNVKYVIAQQQLPSSNLSLVHSDIDNSLFTYRFNDFIPRGHFVGSSIVIDNAADRLKYLNRDDYNPELFAVLEETLEQEISTPADFSIALTHFGPNDLKWDIITDSTSLFVISETYYPPGWKIYLDDQLVDIHKANHINMAIVVPAGKHNLHLKFRPDKFFFFKSIEAIAAILLYGFIIGSLIVRKIKFSKVQ